MLDYKAEMTYNMYSGVLLLFDHYNSQNAFLYSNDNNDIKEESYLEQFMSNESTQDESRNIFHPPS